MKKNPRLSKKAVDEMATKGDVEELASMTARNFLGVETRLNGVDKRFDSVDQRFDGVDQRFDGVDQRLNGMEHRLEGLEQGQQDIHNDLGRLERTQTAMLDILEENNKLIKNLGDLPRRVERLEHTVYRR